MGRGEMHTEFWWGNLKERDLGADERVILKCVFKKYDGRHGLAVLVWFRTWIVVGCC
jgi:hypothetical protein